MICIGSVFGLIYLALGLYALISIISSNASTTAKVLWILIVYFLPIVGWVLWFVAGPKSSR